MSLSPMENEVVRPGESLLTHPASQLRLAAEMPWWGWGVVGVCLAMAGLMIWYLWPRKPRDPFAGVERDADGKPIPPWRQGAEAEGRGQRSEAEVRNGEQP